MRQAYDYWQDQPGSYRAHTIKETNDKTETKDVNPTIPPKTKKTPIDVSSSVQKTERSCNSVLFRFCLDSDDASQYIYVPKDAKY